MSYTRAHGCSLGSGTCHNHSTVLDDRGCYTPTAGFRTEASCHLRGESPTLLEAGNERAGAGGSVLGTSAGVWSRHVLNRRVGGCSSTNINYDVILANACKDDAKKFCDDSNLYPEPGSVITCLR